MEDLTEGFIEINRFDFFRCYIEGNIARDFNF